MASSREGNFVCRKRKSHQSFKRRDEIERQIEAGASEELWDSLYLNMIEIKELLRHVKKFAESMCPPDVRVRGLHRCKAIRDDRRSQLSDIDFKDGVITLRERNASVVGLAHGGNRCLIRFAKSCGSG